MCIENCRELTILNPRLSSNTEYTGIWPICHSFRSFRGLVPGTGYCPAPIVRAAMRQWLTGCRTGSRSWFAGRGKSGLHRAACRLTAGRAIRLDGKCHRKYTAWPQNRVRVKWCGKSAPRREEFRRQGKPHVEQDQIGEEGRPVPFHFRVGCWSRSVMAGQEE